jgi:hypothetical protein
MVGEIEPTFSARFDFSKKLGSTSSGNFGLLKNVKLKNVRYFWGIFSSPHDMTQISFKS